MQQPPPPGAPGPITAVLFDYSSTLVDIGDPRGWLEAAWLHAGHPGTVQATLGAAPTERLTQALSHLWDALPELDPDCQRDLSEARHRAVFDTLLRRLPDLGGDLRESLYAVLPDICTPYADARPTLLELKRLGLRLALVSNIARDLRPELFRGQLLDLFDAVILSFEVGEVKPNPPIFQLALNALGVTAGQALMVGDDPIMDSGGVCLGIRTLLLPVTSGATHGLERVLAVVGADAHGERQSN